MSEMKRWRVETRATVHRVYYVRAVDEKSAEAASCDTTCDGEEDTNEETMSITEIEPAATKRRRPDPPPTNLTTHRDHNREEDLRDERPDFD